ncbi:glycine zipper domain-containing protein [Dyella humicola]|uniref:glycine zipper domain-containing protein n=1 Tax=Dyella humicola TaxID=2992126 RepID=UPI00224E5E1A|nr:glycine zipper domain-containing protein [Dyella humicola]
MSTSSCSFKTVSLLVCSVTLALVSGCAQMPAQNTTAGSNSTSYGSVAPVQQTSSPCNAGAAVAIGALAGALLGKGKGHIVGAVVGAGVGALACTAYNYHSKKVRDAQAVEAEYIQQRGALPASNTVTSYKSSLDPGGTVQAGSPVELTSNIVVVNGTHDTQPQLAETLTLLTPDGKQAFTVTKPAMENQTGEYQTNFTLNLPKGIQNGKYIVRSSLTMNNHPVETNDMPILIVS